MLGKTHCLIGIGVGITIAGINGMGAVQTLACGAVGGVIALLPDVDHPNSTITHKLGLFALPFRLIPHRTITHAVWIPLIILAISTHPIALISAGAWMSHIIADMITPRGVPLAYPLVKRRIAVPLVKTGGIIENALFLGGILGIGAVLYGMFA